MTVRMAAAPLASSDDIPNTLLENAVLRVHFVRSKKECFLMKQKILIAVISGAIWFVAGNAFWYLASPLWINVEVDEAIGAAQAAESLSQSSFVGADRIHQGSGNAEIFEGADGRRILRFTNFKVTNGPDLKVWLVKHPNPRKAADVIDSEYLALGPLKGNLGAQNYDIPAGIDPREYGSVVIWCEQFSVLFATAAFAGGGT